MHKLITLTPSPSPESGEGIISGFNYSTTPEETGEGNLSGCNYSTIPKTMTQSLLLEKTETLYSLANRLTNDFKRLDHLILF